MDIKLDDTGDIDVTDFIAPRMFTDDEELAAIAQRCAIRLRTFLGEWFADASLGVPWIQTILASKRSDVALALLRDHIRETPGVIAVVEIAGTLTDREFVVSFRARTTAGAIDTTVTAALTATA